MNGSTLHECSPGSETGVARATPLTQVAPAPAPVVPAQATAGRVLAAQSGAPLLRGLGPVQQQAALALQRGVGNAAVARMLQRTCVCEEAPASAGACETCATCACGGVATSDGVCESCSQRGPGGPPRAVAGRTMSRRMLQRDAAAKQKVSDAIKNNTSRPDGADPGYEEAFRIVNGLAMYDMLSTLTALRRAGQFDDLNGHFKSAIGVNVARLRVAFDAVLAKGATQPDAFVLAHRAVVEALPVDQRQDIIRYLDPTWFDELKATEDAEPLIAAIRAAPAYVALAPATKTVAEDIIAEARKNPVKLVYYMTKLKLLFEKPTKAAAQIGAETSAGTSVAAKAEQQRLAKPAEAKNVGLEEKASHDRARKWIAVPGKFGGGTYFVDKTDPTNVVVKASVFLKPVPTAVKDAKAIKKMEDAIEKASSNTGYIVDLSFVKAPVAGCFTVDVDPDGWAVATNWAGGDPTTFAHELHHMFVYELDKYDYIEAHAENTSMAIPDRLTWFRKEMGKPEGWNDPTSVIAGPGSHPNDEDVCRVAGLDLATCMAARQKKRAGAGATP